jgi:hypothetical protein
MPYPGCVFHRVIAILCFAAFLAVPGCQEERAFKISAAGTGNGSGSEGERESLSGYEGGTGIGSGNGDGTGNGSGYESGTGNESGNERGTPTANQTGTGTVSGSSKFILVSTAGHFSDAVVHGSYIEKKSLTLADFVVLTVEVIAPGTWACNTSMVKGFQFRNSGNFTTVGKQQIILIATGTPNSIGIAEFPLSIGTSICAFKVAVNAATGTAPVQGEYYYKAIIGGINYFEAVTDPGDFEAGSGFDGVDEASINAAIYHTGEPMPLGVTAFGVTKGIMLGYSRSTDAQFKSFFAPGAYPYTDNGNKNGILIGWRDKKGGSWNSFHTSIRQPASSNFKIISVEDSYDVMGNYHLKVRMQFNCTLFRVGTKEQLELKDGEFVGMFRKS